MQKGKIITLPLVLGVQSVNSKQLPSEKISTSEIQIHLAVKCKLIKALYSFTSSKAFIGNIEYQDKKISTSLSDVSFKKSLLNGQKVQDSIKLEQDIFIDPFKIRFQKEQQNINLFIQKKIMSFHFFFIPKSKFVKNQTLENLMNKKRQENWGVLSMDKNQRIILEPQSTTFPIIGLWINSSQSLGQSINISKFIHHAIIRKGKKCFFNNQSRQYFYFVKINKEKNVPQLFLVEYCQEQTQNQQIKISKKDIYTKDQIVATSDQSKILQFTLRSDEKISQTLMNLTCSPIKFPTNSTFIEQNAKTNLPDSPRFRLDRSDTPERECLSLKRLVKQQQIEINYLRSEVLRLNSQLRIWKKSKMHESQDKNKHHHQDSSDKREDRTRRLTRSDLSVSLTPNSVANCQQVDNLCKNTEDNFWDRFQLVQK